MKRGAVLFILFLFSCADVGFAAQTLTLDRYLRRALRQNAGLKALIQDISLARNKAEFAYSPYDIWLESGFSAAYQKNQTVNIFTADSLNQLSTDISLSKRFPYGLGVKTTFEIKRQEFTPTVTYGAAQFEGKWLGEVNFNLLRNVLGRDERFQLEQARAEGAVKSLETIFAVETKLAEMIGVYWSWVGARRSLKISEDDVKAFEENLRFFRIKKKSGRANQGDIYSAQAALQQSRDRFFRAEVTMVEAEKEIEKVLMESVSLDQIPKGTLEVTAKQIRLRAAKKIEDVLRKRRDYRAWMIKDRVATAGKKEASWNRLPEFNLFSQVFVTGLEPEMTDMFSELGDFNTTGYTVGVKLKVALGDTEASAREEEARVQKIQTDLSRRGLAMTIQKDIAKAYQSYASKYERLKGILFWIGYQEKKLAFEQKDYARGRSDSFKIIQARQELTQAKQALVEATVNVLVASTQLDYQYGKLLDPYRDIMKEYNVP